MTEILWMNWTNRFVGRLSALHLTANGAYDFEVQVYLEHACTGDKFTQNICWLRPHSAMGTMSAQRIFYITKVTKLRKLSTACRAA